MAKSVWTVVVSWSAAAAIVLSTAAPDAAAAVRYGGGFLHGMRSGDSFGGFRPGLGVGQRSFFPGGPPSETGCRFAPSRCGEGVYQDPPRRVGFWPGSHWGGFGPAPYGGGAGPDTPPNGLGYDGPGYGGPDAGPTVAAAQAAGVQGELAGGERLVREFSEAALLALGRCPTVTWPANRAPLDEADAKRLRCVGDVLTVYADKLENVAPILPEKLRSIPTLLRATAKKVRSAKTKAEAASAITIATAEVHKVITLLKADDPIVRSIATREAGQITKTLALADEKLEKAVGL